MINSTDRAKAQEQLIQLTNEQLTVLKKECSSNAYSMDSKIECAVQREYYSMLCLLVNNEINRRASIMLSDALTNKLGSIA